MEGDTWRNAILLNGSPEKRISRNDATIMEDKWHDHDQWSQWTTQFLAPLPKDSNISIKNASNRAVYKEQYGLQLRKPNIPKNSGVYEIRVVTLDFSLNASNEMINESVADPLVVYVGKADDLCKNWNSYRGDPSAKGSRNARRLISKALDGVFKSTILYGGVVRSFAIQVRWRSTPYGFHGYFESILLSAYEYPWNISDNK